MKYILSHLVIILVLSVSHYSCRAGDFDQPYDFNPSYETVFIKHRVMKGDNAEEGWAIEGDTLYGHFDDTNIADLPPSEIGSVTLDGSRGIQNVHIAVDLHKRHDFNKHKEAGEMLQIGSVTCSGQTLDSVSTVVTVENEINY